MFHNKSKSSEEGMTIEQSDDNNAFTTYPVQQPERPEWVLLRLTICDSS